MILEKFYMFFNPGRSLIRAKRINGRWQVKLFAPNVPANERQRLAVALPGLVAVAWAVSTIKPEDYSGDLEAPAARGEGPAEGEEGE